MEPNVKHGFAHKARETAPPVMQQEPEPISLGTAEEGVADVMGLLFNNDAIGSAIPPIGEEDAWHEIGDLERNTPPDRPGYVRAWIRGWYADGKPDTKNLNRMLASKRNPLGWTPRVPTAEEAATYSVVSWCGNSLICVNGMILMERTIDADDRARRINRQRIEIQSVGANLEASGQFNDRYARMFGTVTTKTKVGRDAADLID